MKTHRSSIAPFLFVLTGTVSLLTGEAPAALILTINEATANRLSFTLGGTFDATVIGSDPFYLAIKPDWSTHIGTNVPWLADSLGLNAFAFVPGVTITENTAIGAMLILNKSVEAIPDYRLGDSIFYGTSDTIPAGTAVSGTSTMEGTNIYDYSGLTALQLVSGYNNGTQDWARLEASAPLPEPTTALLGTIGLTLLATRRHRRSTSQESRFSR